MGREWEGEKKIFIYQLFLCGGRAEGWGMMRKRLSSLDKAATGGTPYFCIAALTESNNVAKAGAEVSSASTLASEMKMELS